MKTKYYYAIPIGVLREFLRQNKDEPDTFIQLFELSPEHIFSEQELADSTGELQMRGTVIINADNLPPKGDKNAN